MTMSYNDEKELLEKSTVSYEIERKFILKDFPKQFEEGEKIEMISFYAHNNPNSPVEYRIRFEKRNDDISILRTVKTPSGNEYSMQEVEVELSMKDFENHKEFITSYVKKTRYVLVINNYKWEVDIFHTIDLIMAEVEMVEKNRENVKDIENKLMSIKLPDAIKDNLLHEATGQYEYSNKNLSIDLEKEIDFLIKFE